jgi:hypothetical protein
MTDHKIPDLMTIFGIGTPRELKRFCRTATINRYELASVIAWCHSDKAVFQHTASHRDFVPQHLQLSEADFAALAVNDIGNLSEAAQKAVNKADAMFDDRRMLSGHMFQSIHGWHFLYYDNRDRDQDDNHWVGGPHVHLINHVLTKHSSNVIWRKFCDGNPKMGGALHIRVRSDDE